MMRVGVRAIRRWGKHGCHAWERQVAQPFEADVEVQMEVGPHDELPETLDYGRLVKIVDAVLTGESRNLIETLARDIAEQCLALDARIRVCRVELRKPMAALGPSRGAYCIHEVMRP